MKTDEALLGPWVRRFLLEHLVLERDLARNTQRSYRDILALLLPFVSAQCRTPIDRLRIDDLSPTLIRQFLAHPEQARHCAVATRLNQRLGALHTLARFIALHSPQHVAWCGEIRAIHLKRRRRPWWAISRRPRWRLSCRPPISRPCRGRCTIMRSCCSSITPGTRDRSGGCPGGRALLPWVPVGAAPRQRRQGALLSPGPPRRYQRCTRLVAGPSGG